MIQAYSLNKAVTADSFVPFDNVTIQKGFTATYASPTTIALNKCGVYMVSVDASAAAADTLQLYRDGIAVPQAQSTGTSPSFTTLVQVEKNNTPCPCTAPVNISVFNTTATTLANANIVVTKVC